MLFAQGFKIPIKEEPGQALICKVIFPPMQSCGDSNRWLIRTEALWAVSTKSLLLVISRDLLMVVSALRPRG